MIKTKQKKYDFIIVGSGFAGSVHARILYDNGYDVAVFEKRNHIGGNCYTRKEGRIDVHQYGSHIFHTNNETVWNFITQYGDFNEYLHRVVANTGHEHVVLPFTMITFMQLFNVSTVSEVHEIIQSEIDVWKIKNRISTDQEYVPKNFEEQAIMIVGTTIYLKLIKHYTEKQWGRSTLELPAEIIKRLPLRWNTDTTYFNNAKHQGIPVDGYTSIFENLLDEIEVVYHDVDKESIEYMLEKMLKKDGKIIFTGSVDRLLNYELGQLEYRSLMFEHIKLNLKNYQGTACLNFTDRFTKYTRITEHKHYSLDEDVLNEPFTVITKEFSTEFKPVPGLEPYYPIGDEKNKNLWKQYAELIKEKYQDRVVLNGRLATYQYLDMDRTIEQALTSVERLLEM